MTLEHARKEIDRIDAELLRLFDERLDVAAEVVAAKRATGKPVFDPARERQKLLGIAELVPEGRRAQAISFFSLLMSVSKAEQQRLLHEGERFSASRAARDAFLPLATPFPATATVACQGVEGANSQIAATRLFTVPGISYFTTFEGVCRAVRDGFCEYGVLPIENSTAGSVNAVYDLLAEYRFSIVRSLRLKVDHNLLARPGVNLADVREVLSHEQALAQCAGYLAKLGVKATPCENTAMAAERVATSGRGDVAALASRGCAELYGLEPLASCVQDSDSNYTRFVVVSADPKIFPGAERTSLMLTLKHEPGSLYRVLERFYALGINLVKLESRPIAGRDFEFSFYFDVECPVGTSAFATMLDSLDDVCDHFAYFGSYQEVM